MDRWSNVIRSLSSDSYPLNKSGSVPQVAFPKTLNFDWVFDSFELCDDTLVENNVTWPLQEDGNGVWTLGVDD